MSEDFLNKPLSDPNLPNTAKEVESAEVDRPLILIVDDNAENLQFLGNLLSDSEYEPAVTINGHQALEFIKNETPELILLDIMMPEMDGFEVCRRIKSNPITSDIPLMFLTAKSDTEDLVKGFELGAVDYLIKPFNASELLVRVKTHIELARTRRELEDSNQKLKTKEERINHLNQILAMRVEEKSDKLEEAREELILQEYKSEFAEITSGTLHNVKNLLNSVKTSSELIRESAMKSKSIKALKQANQLLRENMDNLESFISENPKGRMLMEYYLGIEEVQDNEINAVEKELLRISEKVEVIESIIRTQQSYGKKQKEDDRFDLHNIIEDVLMMQRNLIQKGEIRIEKEYGEIPFAKLQRQKFLHVLINLIRNANDALADNKPENRSLLFKTSLKGKNISLEVKDNGCGIDADNLSEIFNHGFTTKAEGHGYGLHSSLSYINEMGGNIKVESDGPGKGTLFTIELPKAE